MEQEPQLFFARRRSDDGRVFVEVGGECDASTLDELNDLLREALAAQPRELIVDLAATTFIDSLTLGSLTAAKQLRARGGTFNVVGATAPEVRRALEITGLGTYLVDSNA